MSPFESERIYLREFETSDWEAVHAYASQMIVCQFQPWGPNTMLDSQAFVNQMKEDALKSPRSRFAFGIIYKETNSLIGAIELNLIDIINKQGEIGYSLNPDYWGQGLTTEAGRLMINFGFDLPSTASVPLATQGILLLERCWKNSA